MPWLGLALSRKDWELRLRRRDAALQSVLLHNANELAARLPDVNDVVADRRRILIARLAQGNSDIESIARLMATSVRSLQRRLEATRSSYQKVLDLTRREAAERFLLNRTLSVSEIGIPFRLFRACCVPSRIQTVVSEHASRIPSGASVIRSTEWG
jgi:AraC-like DNA-binding protein